MVLSEIEAVHDEVLGSTAAVEIVQSQEATVACH
jgi:hypothetical protein